MGPAAALYSVKTDPHLKKGWGASQLAQPVQQPPAVQETLVQTLVQSLGRSPGEGNGSPLQYSCLENSMNRGAWWATVRRVAKIWPQLTTRVQQQGTAR